MYDGDEFERNGYLFRFSTERDNGLGDPWVVDDGYGVVVDWTDKCVKRPWHRIMLEDRGKVVLYDWRASMLKARKDEWGCKDAPPGSTPRQIAALAVEADFQRLRAWCNDEWCWLTVGVEDLAGGGTQYCGGIESDSDSSFFVEVANDLAE
jgi:hypothetical protein